jgi:predicted anti-sigma-YlaC factor YlaD
MTSNNKKRYDCSDIDHLYQQYLDNELNEEQKRLFEEHLEYCLPCDKKISFEMKLREYIHSKAVNIKTDETPKFNLEKILNRPS